MFFCCSSPPCYSKSVSFLSPPLQGHAESLHCSFTIVVGMPISSPTVVHARLDDGSPLLQAVRACDLGIGACVA